jgi:hypothetical protein
MMGTNRQQSSGECRRAVATVTVKRGLQQVGVLDEGSVRVSTITAATARRFGASVARKLASAREHHKAPFLERVPAP